MARKTYGLSGGSFLFELFQLEHDELARLHTEAELFQVILGELRLNHLPKCGEALSLELLEAVRQVQLSQPARQGHRRWRRRRSIGRCDRRLELLGLLRVQAELAEVVRRQLGLQHLGQCVEALRSKLLDRAYIYQTGSHRPHRRQSGLRVLRHMQPRVRAATAGQGSAGQQVRKDVVPLGWLRSPGIPALSHHSVIGTSSPSAGTPTTAEPSSRAATRRSRIAAASASAFAVFLALGLR